MDGASSPYCQLIKHFFLGGGGGIQQPITLSQVQLEKVFIMSSEVRSLVQIAQVSFTLKFILWQMVSIEKVKIH